MSTKVLAATAGTGSSAAAITTIVVSQTNEEGYFENLDFEEIKDEKEPEKASSDQITVTKDGDFFSTDADKWDASGDGGPCTKHYLQELNFKNGPTVGHNSIFNDKKGNANGCLYVHWKKKTKSSGNNWKGVFKLEFLLRKGSEGLLIHGFMKTSNTKGFLDVKARGFLVKKNKKGWKINLTTEKSANATRLYVFQDSDANEFNLNNGKREPNNSKRVFEFTPWMDKACPLTSNGDSECSGFEYGGNNGGSDSNKQKLHKWTKNDSAQNPISSWSVSFNIWWNYFFGSSFAINNAHNWKGSWSEQTLSS